ncbi:Nucleotidylyl transferase [Athelia psychrophila]|uniref:ethanolamine-phosphate cytidylyltransferase n=1 Tax=Athelia psychrophila TaxID=1759441 RepID=A0A166V6P6_9AGAM|nr:Nucleotidylyl transferase [Fibularhizoctonia sp. CBS 109695]
MDGPVVNLWLDGCFDGFHYAHANAIRQAKVNIISGPANVRVVVGIHSDAEILKIKGGPPIFDEAERCALVAGCRWVDAIVPDVPYNAHPNILDKHSIDFVVHGNDVSLDASGIDCLSEIKAMGKYKEFQRTEGVSSTLLLQRILHPAWPRPDPTPLTHLLDDFADAISPRPKIIDLRSLSGHHHVFPKPRKVNSKVIYVGGSWDCFGSAHVEFLERAKALYLTDQIVLVVGIVSDEDVLEHTGEPALLSLLERALAVIQCKYSDALLLNAPRHMCATTLIPLGVDVVAVNDPKERVSGMQVYAPKRFQTAQDVRARVWERKEQYEAKQRRKGLD